MMSNSSITPIKSARTWIGALGMALPVVLILTTWSVPTSISATHYTAAYLFFEGLMTVTAFFLVFYHGYDIVDRICLYTAALGAILLSFFPCTGSPFQHFLPIAGWVSNIIHLTGAVIFFASLFYIIMFQFTKGARNRWLYRVCAIGIAVGCLMCLIHVFIGEWIALWSFGIAWLAKGYKPSKEVKCDG